MPDKTYNVLFLCTGNSARSVMAESLLNSLSDGRFKGYSAGSHPSGRVHPYTIELLKQRGHPVEALRSKSWDAFADAGAPRMDFIITVCDNAAGEVCPIWPGRPTTAHWGFPDPAAFDGPETAKRAVFAEVYERIERCITELVALPIESLDRPALQKRLDAIGAKQQEIA